MKKTRSLADSYVRSPDFADRLQGVQLPAEVWAVFAQCDAPRSPAEIARRATLDEETVASALRRLARRKLVQKHRLDWQAYLASNGAPPPVASAPVAVTPSPETRPAAATPPTPAPIFVSIPVAAPVTPATAPLIAQPLVFFLSNPTAAISRRVDARQELRFRVERTPVAA